MHTPYNMLQDIKQESSAGFAHLFIHLLKSLHSFILDKNILFYEH